jgi:hypothetical protein
VLGEPCVDWSNQITRVFLKSAAYWTSGLSEAITGSHDPEAEGQKSVDEGRFWPLTVLIRDRVKASSGFISSIQSCTL